MARDYCDNTKKERVGVVFATCKTVIIVAKLFVLTIFLTFD